MTAMRLYTVEAGQNGTVELWSIAIVRETPQYYYIEPMANFKNADWKDPERKRRAAFGYSDRIPKVRFYTSAREAIEAFMEWRQHKKAAAQSEIGVLTKEIAAANELLMTCAESVPADR